MRLSLKVIGIVMACFFLSEQALWSYSHPLEYSLSPSSRVGQVHAVLAAFSKTPAMGSFFSHPLRSFHDVAVRALLGTVLAVSLLAFTLTASLGLAQTPAGGEGETQIAENQESAESKDPLEGGLFTFRQKSKVIESPSRVYLGELEDAQTHRLDLEIQDRSGKKLRVLGAGPDSPAGSWNVRLDSDGKLIIDAPDLDSNIPHANLVRGFIVIVEDRDGAPQTIHAQVELKDVAPEKPPNKLPRMISVANQSISNETGKNIQLSQRYALGKEIKIPIVFEDPEGDSVKVRLPDRDALFIRYEKISETTGIIHWTPWANIFDPEKDKDINEKDVTISIYLDDVNEATYPTAYCTVRIFRPAKDARERPAPDQATFAGTLFYIGPGLSIEYGVVDLGGFDLDRTSSAPLTIQDRGGISLEILGTSRHPWVEFKDGYLNISPKELYYDNIENRGVSILVRYKDQQPFQIGATFSLNRKPNEPPVWKTINDKPIPPGPVASVDMGDVPFGKLTRLRFTFKDPENDKVNVRENDLPDSATAPIVTTGAAEVLWVPRRDRVAIGKEKIVATFTLHDEKGHLPVALNLEFNLVGVQATKASTSTTATAPATGIAVTTSAPSARPLSATTVPVPLSGKPAPPHVPRADFRISSVDGRTENFVFRTGVGEPLFLKVRATNPRGGPLSFAAEGAGKISSQWDSGALFESQPNVQPGTYPVVLTATDKTGDKTGVVIAIVVNPTASAIRSKTAPTGKPTPSKSTAPTAPAGFLDWLSSWWDNAFVSLALFALTGFGILAGIHRWLSARKAARVHAEVTAAERANAEQIVSLAGSPVPSTSVTRPSATSVGEHEQLVNSAL